MEVPVSGGAAARDRTGKKFFARILQEFVRTVVFWWRARVLGAAEIFRSARRIWQSAFPGSNAISGLSGNDTNFDKVLEQLKKIESSQLNRLEAWKGDWNLRYEAFGKIIEQVQAASSMLSALSDKNNFVTKNVSSSNENIITAVANASAQDVQHTIKVSQMASNAIWANTGCVFDSKTDIINDTATCSTSASITRARTTASRFRPVPRWSRSPAWSTIPRKIRASRSA